MIGLTELQRDTLLVLQEPWVNFGLGALAGLVLCGVMWLVVGKLG